jgi:hypothetical protein
MGGRSVQSRLPSVCCVTTWRGGMEDTEGVAMALLQYRNTPLLGIGYSPAQTLFGRALKDALPTNPANLRYKAETTDYQKKYGVPFSKYWSHILEGREVGASKKLFRAQERYDEHKNPLAPLSVGDSVSVQNREGNKPLRWDRTGQVVERLENKQYMIKHDGSGRVLLRTRGHLKKIKPCTRSSGWPEVDPVVQYQEEPVEMPLHIPGAVAAGRVLHPEHGHEEVHLEGGEGADRVEPEEQVRVSVEQGHGGQGQAGSVVVGPGVRKSSRPRQEKRDKDFLYY